MRKYGADQGTAVTRAVKRGHVPPVRVPVLVAVLILVTFGLIAACAKTQSPPAPPASAASQLRVVGIEELARLDLLPRLKQSVKVGLVSSYDRSGGNDDGFSGKYSFIRKETGGLVIADL
jgi:hypothetical protein